MIERWVPVDGFEKTYEVSDAGRVRNARGRILALAINSAKYYVVTLCSPTRRVQPFAHQLVARAFVGPKPPGHQVNHKDGNKLNNDWRNLEWVTPKDNIRHAFATGLKPIGEGIKSSKLTSDDVRAMRALYTCGWTRALLARAFRVHKKTAGQIVARELWKHV